MYFSDRESGPRPRTLLDLTSSAWGGIVAQIGSFITNGGFGVDFPDQCPDGQGVVGTDDRAMGLAAQGDVPGLEWPLNPRQVPPTLLALDFVEFCFIHVAEPKHRNYHGFYRHHHLDFYRDDGRVAFCEAMNRVFARNQLAFELEATGMIRRIAPPVLRERLYESVVDTGDPKLDELLGVAREKYLDPDPGTRREGLEKLWDAFERAKTVGAGGGKKDGIKALLKQAAPEPTFRGVLEADARSLTDVGNKFHIRHSEKSQIELESDLAVDYLFHRLFALVWLLLESRE